MENQTWTKKLTELQIKKGFTFNGGIVDDVAVLGFAGEAGEVIGELYPERKYKDHGERAVDAGMTQFCEIAECLDDFKKAIRNGNMPGVKIVIENHGNLIKELADHYYYFNAICNNLGLSFETLAEIVYKKALANEQANPEWEVKR